MGGKKKAAGKKGAKGGKGGAGNGVGLTMEEENYMLEAQKESLIIRLIEETDNANKYKASEGEKRVREMQLERLVAKEKVAQREIISDMTR